MKTLTESQEKLIEQLKNEFLTMNESKVPVSFADILLDEIEKTRKEFALISAKNAVVFKELQQQYDQNLNYLREEFSKLGIGVLEYSCLQYSEKYEDKPARIRIGNDSNYFTIKVGIPGLGHNENGMTIYELKPELWYFIDNGSIPHRFDYLTQQDESFKRLVTSIYHRINSK